MVSTCGKFEAKIRQKVEFTSGTDDAGDEGGQDGKKQEIINNNYYEKYRNDSEVTNLENSDSTDSCDATKVWL